MSHRDADRHPDSETLNRYAEGGPRGGAAAEVGRHVDACPSCRREVEEIRELLRRTAELPSGLEPPRDLWHGVEARIREEGRQERSLGPRAPWGRRDAGRGDGRTGSGRGGRATGRWLAAAAAVLVAVTAGVTTWIAGGSGGEADPRGNVPAVASRGEAPAAAPPALMEPRWVEAGYRPMMDRLAAVVERRGARLPPETREVVERNLGIIDAAIAEAESALARDPASPGMVRALDRSYRQKIDLLRRSARLTAQM